MTEIIWDMSTTVYTSVMVILTYKADIKGHVTNGTRKKGTGKKAKNLAMALGLSFGKSITGYETYF